MNISIFTVNDYGTLIGRELIKHGYNVIFSRITLKTELVISIGGPTTLAMNGYLNRLYDDLGINYMGKVCCVVFDIPEWRLETKKYKGQYILYRKILNRASHIFSISNVTKKQLKNIWNIDSEKMYSVFNNKLIDKYKKDIPKKKQIVAISRFTKQKNFELIIRALEGTDWKLVIIGKGDYKPYEKLVKELGIDCEIIVNAPEKLKIEKICESQLCIHASNFEGLSLVPKEAIWAGTPVIISDIPTHREFHGDTVTYFKPNDLEDLKKKINKVPMNVEESKKQIENLTIEEQTKKLVKWIKKVNEKNENNTWNMERTKANA